MTVKELIELLKEYPEDLPVFVGSVCEGDQEAEGVYYRPRSYSPSADKEDQVVEII